MVKRYIEIQILLHLLHFYEYEPLGLFVSQSLLLL